MSVRKTPCVDSTDVTLADEDTNSIQTDNVNRAIQGNVATQVTQPGGQLCKQCKWCHLMTKFWTNPNCAICWPNLQLLQVVPSGGQICNCCVGHTAEARMAPRLLFERININGRNIQGCWMQACLEICFCQTFCQPARNIFSRSNGIHWSFKITFPTNLAFEQHPNTPGRWNLEMTAF